MKKIFLVMAVCLISQLSFSQAWNGKGDQKIQVGINALGNGSGLTATYDYGLGKIISLGAGANFYFGNYRDNNKDNNFFVFGRMNFHLQEPLDLPSQWDIYPGIDLGLLGTNFGFGAHLGVRYFFTNKVGVFLEAGYSSSLGVSFNL